jgi:hypothetical protein
MRRIIERVVTVVTTTTWTIRWKEDPLPPSPEADPEPSAEILPEAAQTTQSTSPTIRTKEADDILKENTPDPTTDEPRHNP